MTPPEIEQLTADHRATLGRVEESERKHKRARRWIAGAVIAALGTAGASVGKHYLDLREKRAAVDRAAGATAETAATSDTRWAELDKRLGKLEDEIERCGRQGAINATAIEYLTSGQRWIRSRATRAVEESRPARASREVDLAKLEAPPEAVQRKKAEILDSMD